MHLLLIPTSFERDLLTAAIQAHGEQGAAWLRSHHVQPCGFGIAAAGAMTMRHIIRHGPEHVILAGIAGSLDSACKPGTACWFSDVLCDGIGVGAEQSFQSAGTMGWKHLDADTCGEPLGDRIELAVPDQYVDSPDHTLVTGCAGSIDAVSAVSRRQRGEAMVDENSRGTPSIVAAEDMEGFAVAVACRIAGVPLSIVRGISNRAGDRDHANWRSDESLHAVAQSLLNSTFRASAHS